jgi:1,4-alpha-glucan branching enzyme
MKTNRTAKPTPLSKSKPLTTTRGVKSPAAAAPKAAIAVRPSAATTIRLELYAPRAREVLVAGTFNNWQPIAATPQPAEEGKWGRELQLAPGKYEYLFVVDGQWLPDPVAASYVPNPFGGRNSLLEITA